MGAVTMVVTGFGRIRTAAPAAGMDGIMPVVIVVDERAGRRIQASAVLPDKCRVVPVVPGILARGNNPFTVVTQGPDLVGF